MPDPVLAPTSKSHTDGLFHREEAALANRNHGLHLEALRYDVTPAGMHYLLIHFDVPFVPSAEAWRLSIGGRVAKPATLSLADLRRMPQRTLRVTLECAGNGRANFKPRWPSMPWMEGAVGTAEWTGTPLRPLLDEAGLLDDAVDVVFFGADRGFDGREHAYGRALTTARARHDDVLLVTAMNGQPLLPQHGFPLRLLVPGWYGMASVKWLERIEVWDRPFDGPQQVDTYIFKTRHEDVGTPVTALRIKSLMVPPGIPDWYTRRRVVDAGEVTVHGRAWSGDGVPIARVEFACDGDWRDAVLGPQPESRYAWRWWSASWRAERGVRQLMCRATDATGAVQPMTAAFDAGGFGNNSVQRLAVTVR